MLFLLDDRVIEVDMPEIRLARRWRVLGCGDPHLLRARDAVEFARAIIDETRADSVPLEAEIAADIAALIVARTGANAVQFRPRAQGPSEPHLFTLPEEAMAAFRSTIGKLDSGIADAA